MACQVEESLHRKSEKTQEASKLFEIFSFALILPFPCKCFALSRTQLSAMRKLSLSFPTLVTSCPVLPEWQSRVKRSSVKPYLLEVEHVGVVVVLHGDGGVVAGVLHVGGGLSQAGVWVEVRFSSSWKSIHATSELLRRPPPTRAFLYTQVGSTVCSNSKLLKTRNRERTWSATHLVNWCQRVFSHLSLLTQSSLCTLVTMLTIYPVVHHVMKKASNCVHSIHQEKNTGITRMTIII